MVHLFRLRNSLHGRNKLGVFLQSFNSLSGHCTNLNFIFSRVHSSQILQGGWWEDVQWGVVVILVMDTTVIMIYLWCIPGAVMCNARFYLLASFWPGDLIRPHQHWYNTSTDEEKQKNNSVSLKTFSFIVRFLREKIFFLGKNNVAQLLSTKCYSEGNYLKRFPQFRIY